MGVSGNLASLFLLVLLVTCVNGDDPYRFFSWNVTYGDIYPLGVKQQVHYFHIFFFLVVLIIFSLGIICYHVW